MTGLVPTNAARTIDPALVEGSVAMSGIAVEFRPGEKLSDEVLERIQEILSDIMIRPDDVADAVMYALSHPPGVQVGEIPVRPNKDVDLR
jgi:NADP-dependent 3-hydroxy acid dehydrogenase YdfG